MKNFSKQRIVRIKNIKSDILKKLKTQKLPPNTPKDQKF